MRACVIVDASQEELESTADRVREVVKHLSRHDVISRIGSRFDRENVSAEASSPIYGLGNPLAVPLDLRWTEKSVEGRGVFNELYEGPPGHVHGGILSLIFDDLLGRVPGLRGTARVTSELSVRFVRPAPIGVPLVFRAWLRDSKGATLETEADLCVEGDNRVLASADGSYVRLRDDQAARYIPGWKPGDLWPE